MKKQMMNSIIIMQGEVQMVQEQQDVCNNVGRRNGSFITVFPFVCIAIFPQSKVIKK